MILASNQSIIPRLARDLIAELRRIDDTSDPNRLLKKEEVAHLLGVSERTIGTWQAEAGLPIFREGGSVRFPRTAVLKWVADRTTPPCYSSAKEGEAT